MLFKGRVEFLGDGVEDGWVSVGSIAQRLEQGTHNPLVPGSNPGGPTSLKTEVPKDQAETLSFEYFHSPVVDRKGG